MILCKPKITSVHAAHIGRTQSISHLIVHEDDKGKIRRAELTIAYDKTNEIVSPSRIEMKAVLVGPEQSKAEDKKVVAKERFPCHRNI